MLMTILFTMMSSSSLMSFGVRIRLTDLLVVTILSCLDLISRFLQPGTEAVDAFSQDWSSDINWLVPPVTFIGTVLSHMRSCKARGTLVVPMWRSACFWPLLCTDGVHFNSFVADWMYLPNRFVCRG